MRKLRRGRGKRQKQILILSTLVLFSILTIGYAAFQTNISLTAKGNVSPSATYTVNDLKSLVTTVGDGLYEDADEQGRYVFKGGNPNNYLTLNGETWRIMSIESDDTIKIIKDDPLGTVVFDPGRSTVISGITENGSDVGTRYSTTTTDYCYYPSGNYGCNVWGSKDTMRNSSGVLLKDTQDGAKMQNSLAILTKYDLPSDEAYLNIYLNGGTYGGSTVTGWYDTWSTNLSNIIKSYILEDHPYNVGLVSNTSGQLLATDIAQEKAFTWQGRVGLITASEYVRASSNSECTGAYAYRNTSACYSNGSSHNYLRNTYMSWTITPFSSSDRSASVWDIRSDSMWCYNVMSSSYRIRPVLYLSSDTIFKGEGTSGNKFQIANTTPNPNSGSSQGSGGSSSSSTTVYAINTNDIYQDSSTLQEIGTTYSSCAATGKAACLRYTIENNTVTGAEACLVKGGAEYCLTGWVDESSSGTTPIYNDNVLTLQTAFTEANACRASSSDYGCSASGLSAGSSSYGYVGADDASLACNVQADGYAYCEGVVSE